LALSVASERLVEIVKSFVPWLNSKKFANDQMEALRSGILQSLAVLSGILTTWLASPLLPSDMSASAMNPTTIIGLGLLASGGSGFWNAILTYMTKIKDMKTMESKEMKNRISDPVPT
jgi:hypothetical protein